MKVQPFDDRRDLLLAKTREEAVRFAADHWIKTAKQAIAKRGHFSVALSGGSTPRSIYELLSTPFYADQINWAKVFLFWSDERAVPPTHPESNYRMAMESGFSKFPAQVFRMEAETEIEANARKYELLIREKLGSALFDLVMLGVGEDGHTASLFPNTEALEIAASLVAANYIPEKKSWRMTLTFPCINTSRQAVFYVLGASKRSIVEAVLKAPSPSPYPASLIGTSSRKALWICSEI